MILAKASTLLAKMQNDAIKYELELFVCESKSVDR